MLTNADKLNNIDSNTIISALSSSGATNGVVGVGIKLDMVGKHTEQVSCQTQEKQAKKEADVTLASRHGDENNCTNSTPPVTNVTGNKKQAEEQAEDSSSASAPANNSSAISISLLSTSSKSSFAPSKDINGQSECQQPSSKKRKVTLVLPGELGNSTSTSFLTKNASTSAGANFLKMTPLSSSKGGVGKTSFLNQSPTSIAVATAISSCKDTSKEFASETPMFLLPYFTHLSVTSQRSLIKQLAISAQKEQRQRNIDKFKEEQSNKTVGSDTKVCNNGTQTPTNFMSHTPLSSRSPLKLFSSPGSGDAFADMDFVELFSDMNDGSGFFDDVDCNASDEVTDASAIKPKQTMANIEPVDPVTDDMVEKARLRAIDQIMDQN